MPPSVHHFRVDGIDAVETHGVDAATPWHDHRRLVIGVVDRGCRKIGFRDGVVEVPAGSGFVVAPGRAHRILAAGSVDHRAISLPATAATPVPASGRIDDGAWRARFDAVFASLAEARVGDVAGLVGAAVERLGPEPTARIEPGAVGRVRRRLAVASVERPSLADLAATAGLSPWHLQRLFLHHAGLSPHDADLAIRLRTARELMLSGASPSAAAAAAGFADQSHLGRAFARLMWSTPGRWSKDLRRGR